MCSVWLGESVFSNIGEAPVIVRVPTTSGAEIDVLDVESLSRLVQAVGYLKYRSPGNTYLRGQRSLYDGTVKPSLLRGTRGKHFQARGKTISGLVAGSSAWTCKHSGHSLPDCPEILPRPPRSTRWLISPGVPRYGAEPLLQHYGLRTRWIDVVDNLWIALWFACHRFTRTHEYFHVVRRNLADGGEDYVFIITVTIPEKMTEIHPGLYRSITAARAIDLRKAVPSFYLRPHAQHGLLIRPLADTGGLEFAALRIPLSRALEWLGSSILLSPFGLYPPASVDVGYRRLLDRIGYMKVSPLLGYIDVIGPGY